MVEIETEDYLTPDQMNLYILKIVIEKPFFNDRVKYVTSGDKNTHYNEQEWFKSHYFKVTYDRNTNMKTKQMEDYEFLWTLDFKIPKEAFKWYRILQPNISPMMCPTNIFRVEENSTIENSIKKALNLE